MKRPSRFVPQLSGRQIGSCARKDLEEVKRSEPELLEAVTSFIKDFYLLPSSMVAHEPLRFVTLKHPPKHLRENAYVKC